jgi:ATP-dependent DNA ligase
MSALGHHTVAAEALLELRPQAFGSGHHSRLRDPLVEPLWTGIRVLAAVDGADVVVRNEEGHRVDERPEVLAALAEAVRDAHVVVDGFLTREAVRETVGADPGVPEIPRATRFFTETFVGRRRDRTQELIEDRKRAREATTFDPEETIGFVALDLLWLDGEWLVDVPLLERKRLLESVLGETDLIRRGVYVRLPIDTWVGSWRSLGFHGIAFKAPNSRYLPGRPNDDWVTARMPQR